MGMWQFSNEREWGIKSEPIEQQIKRMKQDIISLKKEIEKINKELKNGIRSN